MAVAEELPQTLIGSDNLPELTTLDCRGLWLCVAFAIASPHSGYSGRTLGQVMEAAMARPHGRRSALLENVVISGIASGPGSYKVHRGELGSPGQS
jgi:hypothetical protein